MKEGQWHLEMPKEFLKEPKIVTKVAYNPKDFMTDEQIKKMEDDLKNDNGGEDLTIQTEEVQVKTDQQLAAEQSTKKKKGKNQQKQQQQNQKKGQGKNQGKNNNQGKNKKNKKDTEIEYDFDECDFPLPYSDPRLAQGWYDFNDSTVSPILPGKL